MYLVVSSGFTYEKIPEYSDTLISNLDFDDPRESEKFRNKQSTGFFTENVSLAAQQLQRLYNYKITPYYVCPPLE